MSKRESNCPLCGARLSAAELIAASSELLAPALGVLATRCPHCQGYVEIRPAVGQVDIGYLNQGQTRFDLAITLPCPGLLVESAANPPRLILTLDGLRREFGV